MSVVMLTSFVSRPEWCCRFEQALIALASIYHLPSECGSIRRSGSWLAEGLRLATSKVLTLA